VVSLPPNEAGGKRRGVLEDVVEMDDDRLRDLKSSPSKKKKLYCYSQIPKIINRYSDTSKNGQITEKKLPIFENLIIFG
jgi:hypothetical protein